MEFLDIAIMKKIFLKSIPLALSLLIFTASSFSQVVKSEKTKIRINTITAQELLPPEIKIIEPKELIEGVTFQSEKQSITLAIQLLNPQPGVKIYINNIEVSSTAAGDLYLKPLDLNIGSNMILIVVRVNDKLIREYVYAMAYIPSSKNISPYALNPGKYYALIIANGDYISPQIPSLKRPVPDAKLLKEVLTTRYTFDPGNIYTLYDMKRGNLIMSLDELQKKLTPEDNLFIYYAGHGKMDTESERGFWLLSDADPTSRVDWFGNSTLIDYIKGIKAKHIFLVADACFAGSIFYSRGVFDDAPPPIMDIYKNKSRTAMTSGGTTEVNDESKFTEMLIEHLKANTDQYITSSQLFGSVQRSIMKSNATAPRFGVIQDANDMNGDFVFILRQNK